MKRAWFAIALTSCGGGAAPVHDVAHAHEVVDASITIDASVIEAGPNKLDVLAARHDRVAPGTREIEKREIDLATPHAESFSVAAFEVDTCVRAFFNSDAPTAVTIENATKMTLATADGIEGAIGAAGPVCFRKGDVATFRFNGQSRLRIVVWASP